MIKRETRPRCDFTDLLVDECAHCQPGARPGRAITVTDLEQATSQEGAAVYRPAVRSRPAPQWGFGDDVAPTRGRYETGDQFGRQPTAVLCEHQTADGGICQDCWGQVEICLGDVPALVQDLQAAVRRDTAFVVHGTYRGTVTDPANADAGPPVPFNGGAARVLRKMSEVLDNLAEPVAGFRINWPRPMPTDHGQRAVIRSRQILSHPTVVRLHPGAAHQARRLTELVVRAHDTVDRPIDWIFYGDCPRCDTPIYDERDLDAIRCYSKGCDYVATLTQHHRASLARRADEQLTVAELVKLLRAAGFITITRHTINDLVKRRGLPRELTNRPRWDADGRLYTDEIHVHRLGDVVDLLDLGGGLDAVEIQPGHR